MNFKKELEKKLFIKKYLILQYEIFTRLCLLNLFIKIFFYSIK